MVKSTDQFLTSKSIQIGATIDEKRCVVGIVFLERVNLGTPPRGQSCGG
jgi:hypothetical protein